MEGWVASDKSMLAKEISVARAAVDGKVCGNKKYLVLVCDAEHDYVIQ